MSRVFLKLSLSLAAFCLILKSVLFSEPLIAKADSTPTPTRRPANNSLDLKPHLTLNTTSLIVDPVKQVGAVYAAMPEKVYTTYSYLGANVLSSIYDFFSGIAGLFNKNNSPTVIPISTSTPVTVQKKTTTTSVSVVSTPTPSIPPPPSNTIIYNGISNTALNQKLQALQDKLEAEIYTTQNQNSSSSNIPKMVNQYLTYAGPALGNFSGPSNADIQNLQTQITNITNNATSGNPFNQSLNTTDSPTFNKVTASAFYGDGSHLTGITGGTSSSTIRGLFSAGAGLSYDQSNGIFSNIGVVSLAGTANQVNVSNATGTITLSLPQNIGTASSPTFGGLTLTGLSGVLKASGGVVTGGATTSDLPEGTNLYFTNARADSRFSVDLAATTTDALPEGSTNKYYTDARARAAISSSATGLTYTSGTGVFSLTSGYDIPLTASTTNWENFYETPSSRITAGCGLSWTGNTLSNTGVLTFNGRSGAVNPQSGDYTTTQVAEGTNLYYTNARVDAELLTGKAAVFGNATSTNFFATDATATNASISNFLGTNSTSTNLAATNFIINNSNFSNLLGTGLQNSAGALTVTLTPFTTSNLAEGSNLYFTNARADSRFAVDLATTTTDALPEGSTNKYYTDARARSAISSSATGLTYTSGTGVFSLTPGYNIPLTASTTNWENFYETPSTRIIAGTGLSWSGNTLNATGGGGGISTSSLNALNPIVLGNGNSAVGTQSAAVGYHSTSSAYQSSAFGICNIASGFGAAAFGRLNTASGYESSAFGWENTASATGTSAFGYENDALDSFASAFGWENTACQGATAVGYCNAATGTDASAVGYLNTAHGGADAIGDFNQAYTTYSEAFGAHNVACTCVSSAFGVCNTANAIGSSAFGRQNSACGLLSSAFGSFNSVTGINSSAFGNVNTASGNYSTASGYYNQALCPASSAFGVKNIASGSCSSASGYYNTASSYFSSAFGACNRVPGACSVAVGYSNSVSDGNSTALGVCNSVSGGFSSAFGVLNTVSNPTASASGYYNFAHDIASTAAGFCNSASGVYSSAIGARNFTYDDQAAAVGFNNLAGSRFIGGRGICASAFGVSNSASDNYASAFGYGNIAGTCLSSSLGFINNSEGIGSSALGFCNTSCALVSSAIGALNLASGLYSSASGYTNTASARYSSAFGACNTASGYCSSAFGLRNNATSSCSTAIGYLNTVTGSLSGVFGSCLNNSTASSSMIGVSAGWLRVNSDKSVIASNGACLTTGGVWTNASDRNLKENFTQLDPQDILNKINSLPITEWNYKSEDPSITHIGPVAQDFYSTFHVGNNDTSISTIDPAGVALVGIQALSQQLASSTASTSLALANLQIQIKSIQSLTNLVSDASSTIGDDVVGALKSFGAEIVDGIAYLKNIFVENLTVGSHSHPAGITLYDQVTGEPYCLVIRNGVTITTDGVCPEITSNSTSTAATSSGTIITTDSNGNTIIIPDNTGGGSGGSASSTASSTPPTDASSTPPSNTDGNSTVFASTTPPNIVPLPPTPVPPSNDASSTNS